MLKKYILAWHSALHTKNSTIAWHFKILTIFKFRGISTYMLKKYILAWHSALHIKNYTIAWHSNLHTNNF